MKNIFCFLLLSFLNIGYSNAQNPNVDVPTKYFDLIHTELDLKPVWETHSMEGTAKLTMKPYFYPQNQVILDANSMNINSVTLNGASLPFEYDGLKLKINLGREYTADEKLTLDISYVAHPDSVNFEQGKGISGDKGLYFINTDNSREGVPMHLWTQGETQANSCWFPTFDFPAEKHTQTVKVTYKEDMVSLSNGTLKSSNSNGDGTKTDIWEQTLPHSVYLTVLVVGDYKIVKDQWKGKEVSYYMEPQYEEMARPIFGRTPEMIEFFSNQLGVEYPWDKYSQVIVHDFVAGAMENTTAVTFNDFVQKDSRELIDKNDDETIAHELFHHWFGDLVTCESWANLTLNESFANYSEYLWHEHKDGMEEAQRFWLNDFMAYVHNSAQKTEALYRTKVEKPDDMFDVISYNKGGKILHMLRKTVGDEAFFKTLKHYLNTYKFGATEINDLRESFELITGRDMNWFFDQWYKKGGHPILTASSIVVNGKRNIMISQSHNFDSTFIYRLPLQATVYTADGEKNITLLLDKAKDTFEIPFDNIKAINIDGTNSLVGIINYTAPTEEWIYLLKNSNQFLDQYKAISNLKSERNKESVQEAIYQSLFSPLQGTQIQALRSILPSWLSKDPRWNTKIAEIANDDKSSGRLKGSALDVLSKNKDVSQFKSLVDKTINDQSYIVESSSLGLLSRVDSSAAVNRALNSLNSKNFDVLSESLKILASTKNPSMIKHFDNAYENAKGYNKIAAYLNYHEILALEPDNIYSDRFNRLTTLAMSDDQVVNYSAKIALGRLYGMYSQMEGKQAKNRLKDIQDLYKSHPDLMMGMN